MRIDVLKKVIVPKYRIKKISLEFLSCKMSPYKSVPSCKIDPPCKSVPSCKSDPCAKESPCKSVPSGKKDPACKGVAVQKCLFVQKCPRAKVTRSHIKLPTSYITINHQE